MALGLLVALAKNSNERSLVLAGNIYTTIFRGLPELLTLFIVYYGGQIALQKFVNLFTDVYVEVNSFVAGMIALGLVFSAFSSETFLSAFRGIPKGQPEAGMALGLSSFQRFRLIVFPQLVRLALPGLVQSLARPAEGNVAGIGHCARRPDSGKPTSRSATPSSRCCSIQLSADPLSVDRIDILKRSFDD